MNRIKSAALSAFAVVVALAALGFFATLGVAVIGAVIVLGLVAALVLWVSAFLAPQDQPDTHTA